MGQETMRVTVVGAGTMGHGIAQVAAQSGFSTTLYDIAEEFIERGLQQIDANLAKGVERGKVTEFDRVSSLERLDSSTDLEASVHKADLVIEAAPERMEIKREIFGRVSAAAPAKAILGTNTSSLSVTEIAASTDRPERVIGLHFFNPPFVLRLLEIVRAQQTSDDTLARSKAFGERMNREMIVVSDSPGFATSRLGLAIGLEAMRMLQEGVGSAEDIDRAMELGYRHPMGPLRLTDLVGLDVRLAIAEYLHAELGGEQFRAPQILRKLVRAGKLGKKTGQGFYLWD